ALASGSTPWPVMRKNPISRQVASISSATRSRSGVSPVPAANALTSMVGRLSRCVTAPLCTVSCPGRPGNISRAKPDAAPVERESPVATVAVRSTVEGRGVMDTNNKDLKPPRPTGGKLDTWEMVVVHRLFRREFRLMPGLIRTVRPGDTARSEYVGEHI